MARFYARFDGGNQSVLDNANATGGYFTKRRIGFDNTTGSALKAGLIDSRSALSADIYQDLDSANKSGANGTYFPPNSGPFSTDNSSFVSWSSAYTSSFDGIKTPTTNTYGVADSVNYSKRPTASVLSTSTNIVGISNPADPVGASYTTYVNAGTAVRRVLEAIVTSSDEAGLGRGSVSTPFGRLGNDEARTLFSIWHDPALNYFAWDDFTPGQVQTLTMDIEGLVKPGGSTPNYVNPGGDPVNTDIIIKLSIGTYQYPNDGNLDGTIGLNISIGTSGSTSPALATLALDGGANGGPLVIGTYQTGNGPTNPRGGGNSTWTWNNVGNSYTGILTWTIGLTAGEYNLGGDAKVYDVIVTSSAGAVKQVTTFPGSATNRFDVKNGSGA